MAVPIIATKNSPRVTCAVLAAATPRLRPAGEGMCVFRAVKRDSPTRAVIAPEPDNLREIAVPAELATSGRTVL
jgi:hypothetical protein